MFSLELNGISGKISIFRNIILHYSNSESILRAQQTKELLKTSIRNYF